MDKVFSGLISLEHTNEKLSCRGKDTGMQKYITFHVARHINAIMMIALGADPYTVYRLLKCINIDTTRIHTRIACVSNIKAVDLMLEII